MTESLRDATISSTGYWSGNGQRVGLTPIGRVTVTLLHINDDYRVEFREGLIEEGEFPTQ